MDILSALRKVTASIKTWADSKLETKLDKNLGTDNAGKVLTIGDDGNIKSQMLDTGIIVLSGTNDNPINIDEIKVSGTYLIKGAVTTSMDTTSGSDSAKLNKTFIDGFARGELMSIYSLQDGFVNQLMMNPTRPLVRLDSGEGYSDAIDASYVQPVEKTTEMTQPVGIRSDGQLFTEPFNQVQSDWNQRDNTQPDYLKNKPFGEGLPADLGTYNFTATSATTITYVIAEDDGSMDVMNHLYNHQGVQNATQVVIDGEIELWTSSFDRGYISTSGDKFHLSRTNYNTGQTATITSSTNMFTTGNTYLVHFLDVSDDSIKKIDLQYIPNSVYTSENAPIYFGTGQKSTVQGNSTTASGKFSHAEGAGSIASGDYSHAEGSSSTASGSTSHAEGHITVASGSYSHAEGFSTIANNDYQHAQGKYNIEDSSGVYAHIVGNGSANNRSNAHALDWEGNAWYAGDVYVGSTSGTNKDAGSKKLATEEYVGAALTVDGEDKYALKSHTHQIGDVAGLQDELNAKALATDLSSLETTVACKADKATTLEGYGITDAYTKTEADTKIADAVKYSEQTLTEEQQAQARANIGAVSVGEVPKQVQVDLAQNDETQPDYVKNRLIYDNLEEIEITYNSKTGYYETSKYIVGDYCTLVARSHMIPHCITNNSELNLGDLVLLCNGRKISIKSATGYYSGITFDEIQLYKEIPVTMPNRYLPLAGKLGVAGAIRVSDNYNNHDAANLCGIVADSSGVLYAVSPILLYSEFSLTNVDKCALNAHMGIFSGAGDASDDGFSLTDNSYPVYIQFLSSLGFPPVYKFHVWTADGRNFLAEFSARYRSWDSITEIESNSKNGATFTPSVSDDGIISWTNDNNLANPEPVNIRGKDGTSVTVSSVEESTESSGTNTVTFSDGSTLHVKNGVNGKNYVLTESDKEEIAGMIPGGTIGYPVTEMIVTSASLSPNTYYKWGEIATLTVTLAEPADTSVTNEYCFEFVSGETPTTLSVPDTVKWVKEPNIEAGKTYQVSILNGIGVICGA